MGSVIVIPCVSNNILYSDEYWNASSRPISLSRHIPLWWLDCFHLWYHDQVPEVADLHKIELDSLSDVSNYGHLFIHFVFLVCPPAFLCDGWMDFLHSWYCDQVLCILGFGGIEGAK